MKKISGCELCKFYEYIEEDTMDGFSGCNSGYSCEKRETYHFKTFPCKRKLKCWEEIDK